MKPMRFLLVSRSYPPPTMDGMTRYCSLLARGLAAAGHKVTVLAGDEEEQPAPRVEHGDGAVVVRDALVERLKHESAAEPSYEKLLAQVIDGEGIDAVVLQHPYHVDGAMRVREALRRQAGGKPSGPSCVYVCHTISRLERDLRQCEPGAFHDPENDGREERAFRSVDAVIAVSRTVKENLSRLYHAREGAVHHIRTGIPPDVPAEEPRLPSQLQEYRARGCRLVLYVGRESWEKGTDLLPAVIRATHDRASNVAFMLTGMDDRRWPLYSLTPRTVLLPWLEERELMGLYRLADILLMPSRRDSMPYVLLEAMSQGVVPVVADHDGPGETVIEGVNGFKSPMSVRYGKVHLDIGGFARAIAALAGNDSLRATMGNAAREYVAENHLLEQQIAEFVSVVGRVQQRNG